MARFEEVKERNLKLLETYVPVVDRVHGEHHPEFHEVRRLFEEVGAKLSQTDTEKPDLAGEFARLREITDGYSVPDDVCESYAAVYHMLAELDEAYHA